MTFEKLTQKITKKKKEKRHFASKLRKIKDKTPLQKRNIRGNVTWFVV